jgi:DNA-binding Xre family transcriptional regulator
MLSTRKKQIVHKYVVTSNLGALLKERGLTQKQLSQMTGISERAISRIKNRKVFRLIECDSAVRICLALSAKLAAGKRKKIPIRLDALFPIKPMDLMR